MTQTSIYHISLLFNANKIYDREVIKGIGTYLQKHQCRWDIYLNEDFLVRPNHIPLLKSDGIIADMDDPEIVAQLEELSIPVIGVGSSYCDEQKYPNFPYVATDNEAIIEAAYTHLRDKGLESFAFFGLQAKNNRQNWALERLQIFKQIMQREGYPHEIFLDRSINPITWKENLNEVSAWLLTLPRPTGIIAVTDTRARIVLQACEHNNIFVPNQLAIVGIDNEDLTQYLTKIPLSSVRQNAEKMGYEAAKLLDIALTNKSSSHNKQSNINQSHPRLVIAPSGVIARQSSNYQALSDPLVIQMMHIIYQHALQGIKVEQVVDALGYSRSFLDAKFKMDTNMTIHEALHKFKLDHAESLIRQTNLSFKEIAKQSGYHSVQYLYSVFNERHQLTPKQYREKSKPN